MNPSSSLAASFAPQDRVVPVLLERQAERYGERLLFVAGETRWTYRHALRVAAGYGAAFGGVAMNAGAFVQALQAGIEHHAGGRIRAGLGAAGTQGGHPQGHCRKQENVECQKHSKN